MALDIHDSEKQYRQAEAHLRASTISDRNKALILGYRDACLLHQTCGKVRLTRAFTVLGRFATILNRDFDHTTRIDLKNAVAFLMRGDLAPATIATNKALLRRFMTWVLCPEEFPKPERIPPEISWLHSHVRKQDERPLRPEELIVPAEIDRLLAVCRNPRDRALISILWETGGRIAEIGNLPLKKVIKVDHGYLLTVNGKTGQRTVLIIGSAPHLTAWLNQHPFKDNPDSPLWVHYHYKDQPLALHYGSMRYFLSRTFKRAGITKPYHPHIFRHSRVTYVAANNLMNEEQMKIYFGWTLGSNMPAIYVHLTNQDANNAILREHGLSAPTNTLPKLDVTTCPACKEHNTPTSIFCAKCNTVLDMTKAYGVRNETTEATLLTFAKVLVDRGLINEAATAIHDAGLGAMLRRLAENKKDQQANATSQPSGTAAS